MKSRLMPALLLASVALGGCSKEVLYSKWRAEQASRENFRFFYPQAKMRYNVENDSEFLYLSMDVTDPLAMMKILKGGLRMTFGPAGKKKKAGRELQFPIYQDRVEVTLEDLVPTQHTLEMPSVRFGRMQRLLPNEGFMRTADALLTVINGQPDTNGLVANMRFDSDAALVYDAVIPLRYLEGLTWPLAIGLESGSFKLQGDDPANTGGDVTSNQPISAGDRAMGRGMGMDPYGNMNTPGGSAAMSAAQRANMRANMLAEPLRLKIHVELKRQ